MSMSAGQSGRLTNEPNVTPMIDVLLVLLIIFMLVVPMSRKAIDLQLPDPTEQQSSATPPPQIVLEVLPGNKFSVNKEPIAKANLASRLKEIYDGRPEKIIFVKGVPGVKYADIIDAMDAARGAGVKVIGIPPKDTPGSAGATK